MKTRHFTRHIAVAMVMMTMAMVIGCDNKQKAQGPTYLADSATVEGKQNKTLFGICGDGSAMNTLQFITDNGDTLYIALHDTREKGKVFGEYVAGDRIAVMPNDDKTEAKVMINESTLLGNWIMPDPIDGSSEVGFSIKDGGIMESINQMSIIYKSWKIFNGQLEVVSMREGGSEIDETEYYDMVRLDADSLVFCNQEDTFMYSRKAIIQ